jgi:hypothetical protein
MIDEKKNTDDSEQSRRSSPGQHETSEARNAVAQDVERSSPNKGFSSATPPSAPSGLSSGLQPGGITPGGGPAASVGSIGTGGGQTDSRDSGSKKRGGR